MKSFAGVMQTFLYLKTYFEIKTKSVYGKICQEFKKGRSTDPVLALYADTSLSFGLPASIFAQTDLVKVTGTVTDETNQPVPGVNVLLKGSSNIGTVTDIEGKYTLNIPKDATLIFKFVGYKTTEVAVNGKTTVNLSIQPDVKQLEDVVVIGYQAIKREKSTAAIASVAGGKD